jgi:hypothetical protein
LSVGEDRGAEAQHSAKVWHRVSPEIIEARDATAKDLRELEAAGGEQRSRLVKRARLVAKLVKDGEPLIRFSSATCYDQTCRALG